MSEGQASTFNQPTLGFEDEVDFYGQEFESDDDEDIEIDDDEEDNNDLEFDLNDLIITENGKIYTCLWIVISKKIVLNKNLII